MKKFVFLFFIILFYCNNVFALTPQGLMGKYEVKKVKKLFPDGAWLAVSLGPNDTGIGWFTLDRFRIKVVYAEEDINRDEIGSYIIEGDKIKMTLDSSGNSKISDVKLEDGTLLVKTDYTNDPNKGYYLVLELKKVEISNNQLCSEMELGNYWYNDTCNESPPYIIKGWNLKSIPVKNNIEVSNWFNYPDIVTVWKWDPDKGIWSVWSNIDNILKLLEKFNINKIHMLNYGEGFWIFSKATILINFQGEEYGIDVLPQSDELSGWYLWGAGKHLLVEDIVEKYKNLKTIWKWDTLKGKWLVYSPIEKIRDILLNYKIPIFGYVEKGEGFWANL